MEKTKVIITACLTALSNFLGVLFIPVMLMVGCSVVDYITGLIATQYRGIEIKNQISIRGIYKKVCMWLLVPVGWWMDILVDYSMEQFGIDFGWNMLIATVVAVWIIINEMISILENLIDIGVKIPPFLMPIAKKIRVSIEAVADQEDKADEESN